MSANLVALLKPPRARYFAVMMMSVLRRGDIHNGRKYTGAGDLRQVKRSTREVATQSLFLPAFFSASGNP
jgi:hypothetical protein